MRKNTNMSLFVAMSLIFMQQIAKFRVFPTSTKDFAAQSSALPPPILAVGLDICRNCLIDIIYSEKTMPSAENNHKHPPRAFCCFQRPAELQIADNTSDG
ncbi:hypothetical protein [Photorhabdus viridis]|uniref:hypothetical protein n=1 Tax=Photorhabdus viridis TaxID=3163327 RepID=UPI0033074D8F